MLEGKYRCENKDLFVVGFMLAATTGVCGCPLVPCLKEERWRGDVLGYGLQSQQSKQTVLAAELYGRALAVRYI